MKAIKYAAAITAAAVMLSGCTKSSESLSNSLRKAGDGYTTPYTYGNYIENGGMTAPDGIDEPNNGMYGASGGVNGDGGTVYNDGTGYGDGLGTDTGDGTGADSVLNGSGNGTANSYNTEGAHSAAPPSMTSGYNAANGRIGSWEARPDNGLGVQMPFTQSYNGSSS